MVLGTPRAWLIIPSDLTTIKYVEPAPMGSGEEPKLVTTTVQEYDNNQLQSAYRAQLMGIAMMAFMHLYLKYTNPLLIQSIIPVKGAFEGNLVKVHVFGRPAVGELKRPWKAAGGFMGMGQGEPKSDKASKFTLLQPPPVSGSRPKKQCAGIFQMCISTLLSPLPPVGLLLCDIC